LGFGDVAVNITGMLSIDECEVIQSAGVVAQAMPGSTGNSGRVTLSASNLSLASGGQISTSTYGADIGGDVSVIVSGHISIASFGEIGSDEPSMVFTLRRDHRCRAAAPPSSATNRSESRPSARRSFGQGCRPWVQPLAKS